MNQPTHRLKATGELVFPEGYDAAAIEPITKAAWNAFDREERWAAVREKRDALLAASDPTQLADRPEAMQLAWQPYRQALRDLPDAGGDPDALVWPTEPEEA